MEMERRFVKLQQVEVRAADEAEEPEIHGYAAVFDSLSEDLGGFRERIAPGAFKRSLEAGNDIRALWDHDTKYVLGRNKSGTLSLAEDDRGLWVTMYPPKAQWASDLLTSMKRGDVNQMSFGFYVKQDQWGKEGGETVRTLQDVDLFDVSVVTYPAYPATSAEARAKAEGEQAEKRPQGRHAARRRKIRLLTQR